MDTVPGEGLLEFRLRHREGESVLTKFAILIGVLLATAVVYADDPPLISGQINVFGSRITVSPSFIETPAGIPVFINTTGSGISGILKGELRGPSISGALTFEAVPGQPFQLPGLTTQGTYSFEDIRLMDGDQVVTLATPDRVEIQVIEIFITSLSSRPLTLDEIRALGIVINEDDFSAVSFNITLTFNSQQIVINFPLLLPRRAGLQPVIPPPINGVGFIGPVPLVTETGLPVPLPYVVPVEFGPSDVDFDFTMPSIPGILVFPNEIAFLNQFFAVIMMVSNGASEGSGLAVDDLTAQVILDPDDVKLVSTTPIVPLGSPVPVRFPGADGVIGTADDIELIVAGQTAEAEFFVEGLQEGTHTVQMNLNGILQGLAQGDVAITGTATGAILVRNPNFSLTFSHPSVVRDHEEYDLFVTITNTSTVDANLVSLKIPINALVNCILKSDPVQEFEVIASGESATAKFRIEPLITGQVTASVMTGTGNVEGHFEFRVGVGEEGIPLSPNTLVLPEYANALGPELLEKGLSFLGLAYSAATAPPGSLPPGVPYVNEGAVFQRAVEMAQAGQRFQLGELRNTTLSHLLLDWLGNDVPDQSIDQLRLTTEKGRLFFDEILGQMNLGAGNAETQHNDFADVTFFRNPYLSVMLSSSGSTPNLTITDSLNQSLSSTGGEFGPFLGIPYSDLLRSEDGSVHWGIIGSIPPEFPVSHSYSVSVLGNGNSQSLSIIVPFGQDFYKAEFGSFSTIAGIIYSLLVDQQALNSGILELKEPLGVVVASALLNQVDSTQTSIIAARQDAKADKTGHIVAVLFNRPLTKTSAETLSNYFVENNSAVDARLQMGDRIVYLAFQNPISPLIDNDLEVSGVDPPLPGGNSTVRIETTASKEAGTVTGKVIGSDGDPIAMALVQLIEEDTDDLLGQSTVHVTATATTNAQGEYEFNYVRKLDRAFEVRAQDPVTGDIASAVSIITLAQQLLRVDIIFLGRGTVQGLVYKLDSGNVVPVAGALVQAVSLNEQVSRTALSDSEGRYTFPDVAVGIVNITAQNQILGDPEPFFGATSVSIPSSGSVVEADIEVVSTPAGKVSGRILQSNAIDPIINAYVLLTMDVGADDPLMMATFSDENGWYGFDPVPAGLVTISAQDTATGQTIGTTSVNIPEGGDVTANIVAQGSGSIEVFLVLAEGMNLSDIGVYVENTAFYQDPVQSLPVRFDGVPVGTWSVLAINAATGQTVSGSVSVPYASATGSIVLEFPERGTISGQIFNVDSTPASSSTVLLFGGILQSHLQAVTTADSQGNYLFDDVDFDTYRVHAVSSNQDDGGESPIVTITEQNRNGSANVTFYGKGIINVHVETSSGPAVVSVRLDTVTFGSDGRIRLDISYYKTTDTEGNTTFTNIFRRPFTVVVVTPATVPAIVSGELTGPSEQVNIVLSDNPFVSGVVHDANGTPIQAQVTYEGASGTQTLTTDTQGQFTFTNLPEGDSIFTASAAGSLGQIRLYVQQSNPVIDIHLLGFGNVFGMVKDGSGTPVADASVTLTVPGLLARTLFTETDQDGMYRFDGVPEESITVDVTNGISGGRAGAKIIHNADISLDITLTSTGTVEGTVFKANETTHIPNAEVSLLRNGANPAIGIAASDSNGNFQFVYVPVGSYQIAAIDKTTGRRGETASFSITTNGETVHQDVSMESLGSVQGFVYDSTGTNPIAGAYINLVSHGLVTLTLLGSSGADGSFNFPAVPQGEYTITATADFLAGQAEGSIDTEDQEVEEIILLEDSASIDGTILFADQTPLPAGVVPIIDLTGLGITLRIDAPDGEFHVDDLPLGDYKLTTRFTYNSVPYRGISRITLSVPGPNGLIMTLKGLKTVNVTLQGSLLDITTVTLTYNNDMENRTETHVIAGNSTSFLYVPESSFTVTARTEDATSGAVLAGSSSSAIVGDGPPPVDLIVAVAPSGTVEGIVTDPQSNPVDNVSLTLTAGSTDLFAFSDVAGGFRIDGVTPGSYTLNAEDFLGDRRARIFGVVAEGETNTHTLVLDGTLPSVVSTDPAAGELDVPFDSTISIVFSELMDPASIQGAFLLTSSEGTVSGTLVANGVEWIFTPSAPLEPQRTYSIIIEASAEDLAGNTLGEDFIASFTTIDSVIPTLTNSLPVHMAFNVPLNTNLQLFFSESIQNSGTYTIERNPAGPPLTIASESWNAARTTVTLTFSGPLVESERITFTITGFTDTSGNSNSASIFFDTIDTVPPSDPALTPSANPIREGTPVTITAAVSESLLTVDFFINGVLRFQDTTEPFIYDVPASLTTIAENGGTVMLVEASATDRSGNISGHTALPITLIPDLPPEISIDPEPPPGDIFAGQTIRVNYTASDDGEVENILIIVSGAYNTTIDAGSADSGFRDVQLPGSLEDGSTVFIKARATDDSGKSTSTPDAAYTIVPDVTPPTISITQPPGGSAEVTEGASFIVAADASDNVGISYVLFVFNGTEVNDSLPPFETSFDAPAVDEETTIVGTATAFDQNGNSTEAQFTIIVQSSLGPNLLLNPGNEDPLVAGQIPFWTEVVGTSWSNQTGTLSVTPFEGSFYFYAGPVANAELRQDVDVSAYAEEVDAGTQSFLFNGYVRSYPQTPADFARIVIEYRNSSSTVLASFDSGNIANNTAWQLVQHSQVAPVGTRVIRVRLISTRNNGTQNDGYYDGLSLQAEGTIDTTASPDYEDQPPDVSITAPSEGASFEEGTSIPITVNAIDDFSVTNVEFLVDGIVVFSDSSAPYEFSYLIPYGSASALTLGARAYDSGGHVTTADDIVINILPEQVPPSVSITSPPDGSNVPEGTSIQVTVDASDNFAVASVTLFVDGQEVGTDTDAPYELTILVPTGVTSITLSALATDVRGNTATSSDITLNVFPATVTLITPLQGQPLEQNAEIYAMATAVSVIDLTDYYFLVNGVRVDAFPALKQGELLRFVASFTVPATDTITIEAVAVTATGNVSQSFQSTGVKRPNPFRVLYSLPADGESQVVFNNDWTSPSITGKFSLPLNEAQDFTGKVDLLENGLAIPATVSASGNTLQIQATLISAASYELTLQNIESETAEILTTQYTSAFTTAANIIYVDQNDPDRLPFPPCGIVSTSPCQSLNSAVETAQANDAVLINPGLYFEFIALPINVSLNGTNTETVNVFVTQTAFGQSASDRITIRNLLLSSGYSSFDITNVSLSGVQILGEFIPAVDILDTTGNAGTISILNSQITGTGVDAPGIILNLSGDESSQIHVADNQISSDSSIGIYLDDLDDGGGMRATIERNRVDALTGIQTGDADVEILENQVTGSDLTAASGLAFYSGKNYAYSNVIRGELSTGIFSFSTDFLSNNDLSESFETGILAFGAIIFENAVHDSQNSFGIVSYGGQVLSNQVVHNNGRGSYLVDAVASSNIFRKSEGLGIQQASAEFGFFEFNRIEANANEGAFVENAYGDYGGGIFGSRGGNVFLNNGVNLWNATSITIDARNNSWDLLPPDGTSGPMNTDPATLITPETDPPEVSFITPSDGQNVTANQDLIVQISATDATGVASLGVSIDSQPFLYQSVEPYEIVIPGDEINPGTHTLTVEVFDVWNNQSSLTITINAN